MKIIYAIILLLFAFTAFFFVQGGVLVEENDKKTDKIEDVTEDDTVYPFDDRKYPCRQGQVYKAEFYNATEKRDTVIQNCFCNGDRQREILNELTYEGVAKIFTCGRRLYPSEVKPLCKEDAICETYQYNTYGYERPGLYMDKYTKLCSCKTSISMPNRGCRKSETSTSPTIEEYRCSTPVCHLDAKFLSLIYESPDGPNLYNVTRCKCRGKYMVATKKHIRVWTGVTEISWDYYCKKLDGSSNPDEKVENKNDWISWLKTVASVIVLGF